jgi:hypothetical protein
MEREIEIKEKLEISVVDSNIKIEKGFEIQFNKFGLKEFLDVLNQKANEFQLLDAKSYQSMLEFIRLKCNLMKIKVCHEHSDVLENINKFKNDFNALSDEERAKVFPGIVKSDLKVRAKFVLSTNRHKADFNIPLIKVCNGLILAIEENLKTNKLQVVVLNVPTNDFNPRFKHRDILQDLKKYKVSEIQDGTVINLYYDSSMIYETVNKIVKVGKWVYATKNSFDVGNLVWRGFSYKQVIDDVFKTYKKFNFDLLNKSSCYTFGFKHPAFHPFGQIEEWNENHFLITSTTWIRHLWFIQSVELATLKVQDISHFPDTEIPIQQEITKLNVADIIKKLNRSLTDAQYVQPAFFGLILRAADNSGECDGEFSDILIESKLWNEIRYLIYQLPFHPDKDIRDKQEENYKNMNYVILSNYLNFQNRAIFTAVFSQFNLHFLRYKNIIYSITDRIFANLTNKPLVDRCDPENVAIVNSLISNFMNIIMQEYRVSGRTPLDKKIITRLISDVKYLEIYFDAIYIAKPVYLPKDVILRKNQQSLEKAEHDKLILEKAQRMETLSSKKKEERKEEKKAEIKLDEPKFEQKKHHSKPKLVLELKPETRDEIKKLRNDIRKKKLEAKPYYKTDVKS